MGTHIFLEGTRIHLEMARCSECAVNCASTVRESALEIADQIRSGKLTLLDMTDEKQAIAHLGHIADRLASPPENLLRQDYILLDSVRSLLSLLNKASVVK